ncbi:MAG: PorV/PorQ family protein, partial [Ignavibacteria bacterium]|nr:PorV/PorQ family protein [Ignavibacteria bacterium]
PAAMADTGGFIDVTASHNQWIADIKHSTFSFSIRPASGDYGVFGVSVQVVDYGEILGTVVANNAQGYEDIGNLTVKGTAIGIGYARTLSDAFSIGGQVRWVRQRLGNSIIIVDSVTRVSKENEVTPLVFDFGTLFKTGFRSLTFGMSVRNFSKEVKYEQEGFELPLTFTFGLSMDMMDFVSDRSLVRSVVVSADAVHHRDFPEQIYMGAECNLLNVLALRAGYVTSSDEAGITMGLGVSQHGLQVDYAYTPFGVFDKVQRFTVRFSM